MVTRFRDCRALFRLAPPSLDVARVAADGSRPDPKSGAVFFRLVIYGEPVFASMTKFHSRRGSPIRLSRRRAEGETREKCRKIQFSRDP